MPGAEAPPSPARKQPSEKGTPAVPSIKTNRSQKRKARVNRIIKTRVKTRLSKAHQAVEEELPADETDRSRRDAARALDRAAKKGVIHPNTAARKRSRLDRKVSAANAN